jgi:hypothetical protein
LPPHAGADEERLLLAIQKPKVDGIGPVVVNGDYENNYVTVEFKSGPNIGGSYSVKCYAATETTADNCSALDGLEPQGVVDNQPLPTLYGSVVNKVTGLYSETVDCFVFATGPAGKVEKCQVRVIMTTMITYLLTYFHDDNLLPPSSLYTYICSTPGARPALMRSLPTTA